MPANRRKIVSLKLYELEMRTRTGLPFTTLRLMRLLLASAIARTQRDHKVVLNHCLFMGNHPHMIIRVKDAEQCKNFYSELMKKITDYMKRLLNLEQLELWEPGGPVVSEILDEEGLVDRIAYLYCNPAHADLVESISDYPGFSSWGQYRNNPKAAEHSEEIPWIRQPSIPRLRPGHRVGEAQDKILTERLIEKNKKQCHKLTIRPNECWEAFEITDPQEIAEYNQAVFAEIKKREAEYAENRRKAGKKVMGAARLKDEPLFKPHTPKRDKSDRKVLFHTTVKALALQFLEQFRKFCNECADAFLAWKGGNYGVKWPPGAFRPPMCPLANAL